MNAIGYLSITTSPALLLSDISASNKWIFMLLLKYSCSCILVMRKFRTTRNDIIYENFENNSHLKVTENRNKLSNMVIKVRGRRPENLHFFFLPQGCILSQRQRLQTLPWVPSREFWVRHSRGRRPGVRLSTEALC
jgi:hypothetical protein